MKRRYFGRKTLKADICMFGSMYLVLGAMYFFNAWLLIPAAILFVLAFVFFPKLKEGENLYE